MWAARVISYISNPIFILLGLPYFLIIKTTEDQLLARNWALITWVFLLIFVLFVIYGVNKKIFSDVDVSNREQRALLYFFGALLSFLYIGCLILFKGPLILYIAAIGILTGIFIGSLVNLKIKASVHVATATALVIGLVSAYGGYYYFLLLLIPAICWARVKIRRHRIKEVIAGGILGCLLSLLMYNITVTVLNI